MMIEFRILSGGSQTIDLPFLPEVGQEVLFGQSYYSIKNVYWTPGEATVARCELALVTRTRIVTFQTDSQFCAKTWAAYCPERNDLSWQYASTEGEARSKMWNILHGK